MFLKIVPVILAAAFVAGPAAAQSNPPANAQRDNAQAQQTKKYQGEWRSSKLIGLDVYNQQNEKIGDINEVLIEPSGKVAGYVIGVGGFLGMGEHDVLLTPDKIKFSEQPRTDRTADANRDRPANADRNASAPSADRTASAPADRNAPAARNDAATTGAARNDAGAYGTSARDRDARRNDEMWAPDHAMVNMSKEQVKAMPQFKYSNYN